MKRILARLFLAAPLALACGPFEPPETPETQAERYVGEADCADYCANMQILGCEEGKPTPGGASCLAVCENAQTGPIPFNTECAAQATSCEVAEDC